jgi:hypothetical protein
MNPLKNIYYVRTAKKTIKAAPRWSEWYGPIIAYGPYTAALHIARKTAPNKSESFMLAEIITNEHETLKIEFRINQITNNSNDNEPPKNKTKTPLQPI